MKRWISILLAAAMVLALLPTVSAAQTPASFGWNSDGTDYTGWTAVDADNFTVYYNGSNNHRVWQPVITDPNDFSVTVHVEVSEGGRAYLKIMDAAVELNCSGGNGNQIYNNNAGSWFDAAGRACDVTVCRESGGTVQIRLTGAGNATPLQTELSSYDAAKSDLELGVYDAGNTAAFTSLSVRVGASADNPLTKWQSLDGSWSGSDAALTVDNSSDTMVSAYGTDSFSGAFTAEGELCFTKFYQDSRLGTARLMLTGSDAEDGFIICDVLAENNGKVYLTAQYQDTSGTWVTEKVVDWVNADAGQYSNNYKFRFQRGDGAGTVLFTLFREDGTTAVGGASIELDGLSAAQLASLRHFRICAKQAALTLRDFTLTDDPDSSIGGSWSGDANSWVAPDENHLQFTGTSQAYAYDTADTLSDAVVYTMGATVTFSAETGARQLVVADQAHNTIAEVQLFLSSDGKLTATVNAPGTELGTTPETLQYSDMKNKSVTVRIVRLQGHDTLIVNVGGQSMTTQKLSGLDSAALLGVGAQCDTVFSDVAVKTYDPVQTLVCGEGRFSFGRDGSWDGTTGWTHGSSTEEGLWAQSSMGDGASAAAAFLDTKLADTWTANATATVISTQNSGRAVSKLQLLDQYKNPKVIVTCEKLLSTGQVNFTWQTIESANGGSWKTLWTTGWQKRSDNAYNFQITRTSDTELSLTITGSSGYTAAMKGEIAQDVMQVLCYLGLLTEKTSTRFSDIFITTVSADTDFSAAAQTAYENMMKNFLDTENNCLKPVNLGFVYGTVTNTGNTIVFGNRGSMWESSVMLMAMDTYARTQTVGSEAYNTAAQRIANTVNLFTENNTREELTAAGGAPYNYAMDDCGWNTQALLLGYRYNTYLGNTEQAAYCLELAQMLFDNAYSVFYDDALGGGMWYNKSGKEKSLYAATLSLAGLDLHEITGSAETLEKSTAIYRGVEENLRRADGLYWMSLSADGYTDMDTPYGISEGGSCTYIGGNISMAILNVRFGNLALAQQTLEGIERYETDSSGAFINDRDAWNNTYFLGLLVREVLDTGLAGASAGKTLQITARKILNNCVFDSGYYSASWQGPKEPYDSGYPSVAGSADYYTGVRNRWGTQLNENLYIGSTPNQMMTTATTAHVLLAAGALQESGGSAYLTALTVDDTSLWPVFGPDVTQYCLTALPGTGSMTLRLTAVEGAVVCVNGTTVTNGICTLSAAQGDAVAITVTSADGKTVKTYTIRCRAYCAHAHTAVQNAVPATCLQAGYSGDTVCLDCGQTLSYGTALAALGHDYRLTASVQPTCRNQGSETYTCTRCGETYTTTLPMTEHNYVNGVCTFCGTINPDAPDTFADVVPGKWYFDSIYRAVGLGLFAGMGEGRFAPNAKTTRAMVVTILYRLAGRPASEGTTVSFTDVAAGKWYADAVGWASAKGIVSGYSDGRFGPNDAITREQAAAILWRFAQYRGLDVSAAAELSGYPDAASVSAYALTPMRWAVAEGLISGSASDSGIYLKPKAGATRAELAAIFVRFAEKLT